MLSGQVWLAWPFQKGKKLLISQKRESLKWSRNTPRWVKEGEGYLIVGRIIRTLEVWLKEPDFWLSMSLWSTPFCPRWVSNNKCRDETMCDYYSLQVTQEEKKDWGVPNLLTACPTISLVVDLTNTYRYIVVSRTNMLSWHFPSSPQVLFSQGVGGSRGETCENSRRGTGGAQWGGGSPVLQVSVWWNSPQQSIW